ncbi:2,3-diaminopropionate biosynthesis protein SbnA [Actinomadura litoris]|uniref:2,3-diaminopropionate biosynthesis protein SbnA n=1 Tax=Actinomadura litoris TaxID=2678616 RepID=UPI001FA72DF9|nr:2,3-diaminopropionate biosynthesis protein SbnA [Actinomadura litoris]
MTVIFEKGSELILDDVFLALPDLAPGREVLLKIECMNPAGSIKMKTALALIEDVEAAGALGPGKRVIESSSGNLGIALAAVCTERGYDLTIVTDPNATSDAVAMMRAFGADVRTVTVTDANGGYLGSRLEYIRAALAADPALVWPNQYANPANARAHERTTAPAILKELGHLDALFVGVGTAGTLRGCLDHLRAMNARTRVFAVDTVGSVTFGGEARPRFVPGIGSSRRPELFEDTGDFDKVLVHERDAVRECRLMARRHGLLVGGSTGSVLAAARRLCGGLAEGARCVVISPDSGAKYLKSVFSDPWVAERHLG